MKPGITKTDLVVPSVDSSANSFLMDVVGNKDDTTSCSSIVGLVKGMSSGITDIDGLQDVPLQNSADNVNMRDVIGNKTDTIAGDSIVSLVKVVDGLHDVPGVDGANNSLMSQVIGNKSDTSSGGSIVGLTKAFKAKTDTIPTSPVGASDITVPTADVATNTTIRDVIGNKNDTSSGTSLMAYTKSIDANTYFTRYAKYGTVITKTVTLSGAGSPTTTNLFTVTGNVEILYLFGVFTAAGNTASMTAAQFTLYDGTNTRQLTGSGGTTISGATVNALIYKTRDGNQNVSFLKGDACYVVDNDTYKTNTEFIVGQKYGTNTYIRFSSTNGASTACQIIFYCVYSSRLGGSIAAA